MAEASPRVALVVGNASYQQGRLANPTNDAQDVSRALRQLGFQVDLVQDTNRSNLHRAIQKFRSKLNSKTEVALFFYAGHGAQFEGQSFLLPLRANIKTAADLEIEALSAKSILTQMRSTGSLVNIMILDACRNLPYPALNRSSSRGLARIETIGSALLAFATAPGQVAADGRARNSPYTTQLLTHLKKPGLTISQLFNDVGFAVHRSTGGRQTPWMNSSPMPAIYLAGNKANTTAPQKPSVQSSATSSSTLHSHNGREHDHPLPTSGKNHQHGGATTPAVRVKPAPAVPQRDSSAQLAEKYLKGIGVKRNPGKAFAYATKASKAGDVAGNHVLGLMYASGQGTTKNPQLAFKNMKIASDKGLPQAQYSLGAMYIQGVGTSKNPQMAFRMFQLAANKNIPMAQHNLGLMYLNGQGTKKNPSLAFNWFNKAAQKGLANSQFLMGDLYVDGVGVTKNYQQAMLWYRKAANQGLPNAEYSVGALFANGFGVRKDLNKARIWFNKAAKQGLARGKNAIEQLDKMTK